MKVCNYFAHIRVSTSVVGVLVVIGFIAGLLLCRDNFIYELVVNTRPIHIYHRDSYQRQSLPQQYYRLTVVLGEFPITHWHMRVWHTHTHTHTHTNTHTRKVSAPSTAVALVSVLVLNQYLTATGDCPNECSGHGYCKDTDFNKCICHNNWRGIHCHERAWIDELVWARIFCACIL